MSDFFENSSAKKTRGKNKLKLLDDGTAVTAKSFPADKSERFISLLRNSRIIWDASLPIHERDAQAKEKAWDVMAAQLALKIEILKAKYRSLRTTVCVMNSLIKFN